MMMISEVEIEEKTREKIITLFWYLIDLEQETIDLNSILLTQVFDIGDIGLEIVQVCDVFEAILFKNFLISFLEKTLELKDQIIQDILILVGLFEKSIHQMNEFIAAYNRVNESGDLIGNHRERLYISSSLAHFGL